MKIEKGIAAPCAIRVGRPNKWPELTEMDVGDSFQVEAEKANSAYCAAQGYGRKTGKKFTIRKQGKFSRIWRIK